MIRAVLIALLACIACAVRAPSTPPVATFSIVACDPQTGELGVAVQSKFLGVGAVVPWAKAGIGAVATQSYANTTYGPRGLALLEEGVAVDKVLDQLLASDDGKARRQVGIVDAKGKAVTFTGEGCMAWAGGIAKENFCVQGNILAGEAVVTAMAKAFESREGDLGDRMIEALAAGQEAGGDKRGRQSAALLIVKEGGGYGGYNDRYRDVRVDDHPEPIAELARIYAMHKRTFRTRR